MAESRKSIVERAIARIAKLVAEKPKRMLLAGILFFAALFPGTGKVYQNIKYYIWFEEGDPRIELLDEFELRFGSDLASILVIHSPSGIFDKDSAEVVIEVTDRMWKTAETIRVESLSNFPWVHAEEDELIVESLIPDDQELTPELLAARKKAALEHEQLPGFLVSKDGNTAVIFGWLQPTKTDATLGNRYNDFVANTNDIKKIIEDYEDRTDHEFYLAGLPVTEGYLEVDPPKQMQQLTPLILLMCMVLLFVFFRRVAAMLLPFAVIFPAVMGTLGVAGWADIQINPETITSPNIMVIIAVSCSVHVMFAYFRLLDRGKTRREAAQLALAKQLVPTFFSCLTIGIGFLSLLTMTIPPLQELGILVAAGTAIVWILLCLVLGPLLVILPIKAKKKKSGALTYAPSQGDDDEDLEQPTPRGEKLTAFIDRWKTVIVAGWAAILGVSLWLAYNNSVTFDPADWYDKRTDVRKSMDFIREHLGPSESFEIMVDSGKEEGIKDPEFLGKVEQLNDWLHKREGVVQVFSVLDILKETNRALFNGDPKEYRLPKTSQAIAEEYLLYTMNLPLGKNLNERVTLANDALRMTVLSQLRNSPAVLKLLDEVAAKGKELGLDVKVTGRSILTHQVNPEMVPSFFKSMLSGTLVIFFVLLIYFRSLRLASFGLFLELIPLAIGAGIIFWALGKNFDMATISTFSIVLGVTVDDTVHFLHGYGHKRREGFSPRESITRLWSMVAAGMLVSQLILACCFALFVTVVFPIIRYMGIQVACMLVIAFIANVTLSPALLLLFSRDKDKKKA